MDDPFVSQNRTDFYGSRFLWLILVCAYTIWYYGQISVSCTIPGGSPFLPSRIKYYTLFTLFATFAYHVINGFVSFTAESTFDILLSIIGFGFNIIAYYGVVFFTAIKRSSFSLDVNNNKINIIIYNQRQI